MNRFILLTVLGIIVNSTNAQTPTWSEDIAKIVYSKCANCHNPNGIGGFSLLTYNDAKVNGYSLKSQAVTKGTMPPWPADPKYVHFKNERVLSTYDKDKIARWVDGGMPEGDPSKAPTVPVFSNGSKLPSIDLSLRMPSYISKATTADLYRCFVLDPALTGDKKIEQIEVIPGNKDIVHHVLIFQDTTTKSAQLDAADPDTGYTSFGGIGTDKAILIGAWVPGSGPKILPTGLAMTLFKKAKIVLQIHYPRGTNGALDSTRINIKYSTAPSTREVYFQSILNHQNIKNAPFLAIPKDTVKTFVQEFTVPLTDFSMFSIAPHMHLVGVSYKVFAVTPTNDTIRGIDIPKWDFHWQDEYTFKKIVKLPLNSKLYGVATYDNTSNNPNNPNNPPKLVLQGEATNDEMMLTFVSFMPYQAGDENVVLDTSADIYLGPLPDTKGSAIGKVDRSEDLMIYPAPAKDKIQLIFETIESGTAIIRLFDAQGKMVMSKKVANSVGMNKCELNVADLARGWYTIHVEDNCSTMNGKMVLE